MMGSNPSNPAEATSNAGLYVLAAHDIFSTIKRNKKYQKMKVMVSCFEIYGGKLFDLLNSRSVVKCLEDSKQRVQVVGLTEHSIHDVNDLLSVMSSAHSQRSTGSTGANAESSRSHQIMQIVLKNSSDDKLERKLSFIDLAGSERGADTNHSSKQTRLEGAEINTSLLALKEVIRSLERKNGFTPFRGSKLTQVLKDSFVGERTRTCMIACVSPSHVNCEHTLNTLRYADRVKEHQASENRSSATAQCEPTLSEELEEHPRRQSISLKQKMGESEQQNRKSRENKLPIADSQIRPKSVPVLKRNTSGLNQEKNVDLIRKTVNLLSAHKLAIAEMVEVRNRILRNF
jgi:kinesin family protein 2/24